MRKEYAVLINDILQQHHFTIENGACNDMLSLGMSIMAVQFIAKHLGDNGDVSEMQLMIDNCRNWIIPQPVHQSVN